ncbi:MAG: response regulator [Chitinophagaceae bacterium]
MSARIQTAMIIDDDVDFTMLLTTILEQRKIHVMTLHTLQEADDYLSYLKPTVIFLDNSFPEGLGINFISRIKEADMEIKIIMMTGDSAMWIHEKAVEEGIDFFLQKPVSRQIIDGVLDQLHFRKAEA